MLSDLPSDKIVKIKQTSANGLKIISKVIAIDLNTDGRSESMQGRRAFLLKDEVDPVPKIVN